MCTSKLIFSAKIFPHKSCTSNENQCWNKILTKRQFVCEIYDTDVPFFKQDNKTN